MFHLAGVNRPPSPDEFATGNAGLTEQVCEALAAAGGRSGDPFVIDPGGAGQPLWPEQAGGGGSAVAPCCSDGGAGLCVPPAERLRQMVPPELQLGGGHVLPQHRARFADQRERRPRH